jgi:hypothetical protein
MAKDKMGPSTSAVQSTPAATVKRSLFEIPQPAPVAARDSYWLGLISKCPFHVLHAGGVAFTKFTNPPIGSDRDTGLSLRKHTKGDILQLSRQDVDRILERVGKKVIRIIYEPDPDDEKNKERLPRAQVLNTDNAFYNRNAKDVPMAQYAFLIRVDDIKNPLWQHDDKTEPPTLWDMAEEDKPAEKTTG